MTEITVLSTTAVKSILDEIIPRFETATDRSVKTTYAPSAQITIRMQRGETADVVIATAEVLDQLIVDGRILDASDAPLAQSVIGLAVPKGAPRPDISSAQKFKAALLQARSIATSNPVNGGQSGRHLAAIFEQLGIAEPLKPKLRYGPGGPAGLIGLFLTRGEAEIGIQQMPELMAVSGIDIVGPLPSEIQVTTVFSAAIVGGSTDPEGGAAFIKALTTEYASTMFRSKGFAAA